MPRTDPIPELKRQLCEELVRAIEGFSLSWAAGLLQIDGNRVAELRRGDLRRFSLESLIRFADRAGLEIVISANPRNRLRVQPPTRGAKD